MPIHRVREGECISSLALGHGIDPEVIWNAASNGALRHVRPEPNVLATGDEVDVPSRETKRVSLEANRSHVLALTHTHVTLRLRLEGSNGPLRSEPYVLHVDGDRVEGETDDDGWIEQRMRASATRASLLLVRRGEEYRLDIGHLEPANLWRGAAQRLRNLGFWGGPILDTETAELRAALLAFQKEAQCEATGWLDAATVDALRSQHGS